MQHRARLLADKNLRNYTGQDNLSGRWPTHVSNKTINGRKAPTGKGGGRYVTFPTYSECFADGLPADQVGTAFEIVVIQWRKSFGVYLTCILRQLTLVRKPRQGKIDHRKPSITKQRIAKGFFEAAAGLEDTRNKTTVSSKLPPKLHQNEASTRTSASFERQT